MNKKKSLLTDKFDYIIPYNVEYFCVLFKWKKAFVQLLGYYIWTFHSSLPKNVWFCIDFSTGKRKRKLGRSQRYALTTYGGVGYEAKRKEKMVTIYWNLNRTMVSINKHSNLYCKTIAIEAMEVIKGSIWTIIFVNF